MGSTIEEALGDAVIQVDESADGYVYALLYSKDGDLIERDPNISSEEYIKEITGDITDRRLLIYVGKTRRDIETRVKEHEYDPANIDPVDGDITWGTNKIPELIDKGCLKNLYRDDDISETEFDRKLRNEEGRIAESLNESLPDEWFVVTGGK